jgi:hypothetical protein
MTKNIKTFFSSGTQQEVSWFAQASFYKVKVFLEVFNELYQQTLYTVHI